MRVEDCSISVVVFHNGPTVNGQYNCGEMDGELLTMIYLPFFFFSFNKSLLNKRHFFVCEIEPPGNNVGASAKLFDPKSCLRGTNKPRNVYPYIHM